MNPIIGCIGSESRMWKQIYSPKIFDGHPQIGYDPRDKTSPRARLVVSEADVTLYSIWPMARTARVIAQNRRHAKPGSLQLNTSSVQSLRGSPAHDELNHAEFRSRGVDVGGFHLLSGPSVQTLEKTAALIWTRKPLIRPALTYWLLDLLVQKGVVIYHQEQAVDHDAATNPAQLEPMVFSTLKAMIWNRLDRNLEEVYGIAGPPAKMQLAAAIRHWQQARIIAEIIALHPHGPGFIRALKDSVLELEHFVTTMDHGAIAREMETALASIDAASLRSITASTNWLTRILSDLNGAAVGISFQAKQDRLGLLAETLGIFDWWGINKTTTTAQKISPGGEVLIFIGIEIAESDPRVMGAKEDVRQKLGGEILEAIF